MTKKQLGEKQVYFIFHFAVASSLREFKAITGAHVMEVFCSLDHPPWLTQPASFYIETTFLGVPLLPKCWAHPHQLIRKMPYRLACRESGGDTSHLRILFPGDFNLCYFDKNLTKTHRKVCVWCVVCAWCARVLYTFQLSFLHYSLSVLNFLVCCGVPVKSVSS